MEMIGIHLAVIEVEEADSATAGVVTAEVEVVTAVAEGV